MSNTEDLEARLTQLKKCEERANQRAKPLLEKSHILFERAKYEESELKSLWYTLKASVIQYFGVRHKLKASDHMEKYWHLRKELKTQIEKNARILGYQV